MDVTKLSDDEIRTLISKLEYNLAKDINDKLNDCVAEVTLKIKSIPRKKKIAVIALNYITIEYEDYTLVLKYENTYNSEGKVAMKLLDHSIDGEDSEYIEEHMENTFKYRNFYFYNVIHEFIEQVDECNNFYDDSVLSKITIGEFNKWGGTERIRKEIENIGLEVDSHIEKIAGFHGKCVNMKVKNNGKKLMEMNFYIDKEKNDVTYDTDYGWKKTNITYSNDITQSASKYLDTRFTTVSGSNLDYLLIHFDKLLRYLKTMAKKQNEAVQLLLNNGYMII